MKTELIRAEKISKRQGSKELLSDAWITVFKGEVVGVAGLEGAGRTTLMNLIARAEKTDAGYLYFKGSNVWDMDRLQRRQMEHEIVYITHESTLVDKLSIVDNLFVINGNYKKFCVLSYKDMKKQCSQILSDLSIEKNPMKKCEILEDNEKQRLEIMKSVINGASLIILNCVENVYSKRDILLLKELMQKTKKQGISYIFITNVLDDMMELSDTMFVLKEGRTVKVIQKEKFNKKQIYNLMTGYKIDDGVLIERTEGHFTDEVLRMENISRGTLKGVSLKVHKTEIVGVLSLSNKWKEDLMNVLLGNEKADAGEIFRNGKLVTQKYLLNRGTMQNRCCIIPYPDLRREIYDNLSPQQNYLLLAEQKVTFLPMGIISKKLGQQLYKEAQGLPVRIFDKPVSEFSSSERFELVMGRIRLFRPELLVMNSPMEVADLFLKKRVREQLILLAEEGTGILITGSNYEELTTICDRILIQKDGKLLENVERKEFEKIDIDGYLN